VQSEKTEICVEIVPALDANRRNEPALRNPSDVLRRVFSVHSRLRYEFGA